MKLIEKIKNKKERTKLIIVLSALYNYIWSSSKILLGIFLRTYFICVSGLSTFLVGIIKTICLKGFNQSDDLKNKKSKIVGGILVSIGITFGIYMARLFFIENNSSNYGLIPSISIAFFSFVELVLAIKNLQIAKKGNNLLYYSLRMTILATGLFAIVNTQSALLTACNEPDGHANAILGSIIGLIVLIQGTIILIKANKLKKVS